MGTLYVFVIIVTLSTHCSGNAVSNSETYRSIASVLLKEGQSAKISCMTKGTGDYFWRKGIFLHNSTLVASFTVGEVTDDSQPYSVTVNGTLHIRSVTLKDEGNYFCRVSSTENECYGEVKILVQASLLNFDLAIDRCERESSCLLYLDPSQSTSVTCTALNAPPLMTLKWFNGSKEITEGIVQNELLPQNGNSREITSTVASVYGRPASLTCQAVDPKRGNDDVRFAHAQVEMTVPAHDTLPSWIIVAVTLAGCFIVFGIYLLIKAKVNRKQRKKYAKLKREDVEALTVSAESKDSELSELKGKLRQTEEELKKSRKENIELQTKAAKDEAKITYAETKLQQRDEEIKKAKNENLELQTKIANNETKITAAKESAKTKDQEIKNKIQELTDLKSKVPDQIQEMSTLKGDVRSKTKAIADLESKLKQQEEEVKKKYNENIELQKTMSNALANYNLMTTINKKTVEQKDSEIKEQRKQILECQTKLMQREKEIKKAKDANIVLQTNLQRKEIASQGKSDDILKLKGNSKEKDVELAKIKKELDKLKDNLIQQEAETKKERTENVKLQETIASVKGENTVAEDLAERRNKEISELKETVKQKDKEINNQREQYLDCQTNLQKKEIALEGKSNEISDLKGNLTAKDNELAKIKKELEKLKEDFTQKEHQLQDLYKESRSDEKSSHRQQGKKGKRN